MPGQGAPFEDKGETGQTTEADRSSRADYEKTWCGMLAGLKKVAES